MSHLGRASDFNEPPKINMSLDLFEPQFQHLYTQGTCKISFPALKCICSSDDSVGCSEYHHEQHLLRKYQLSV